MKVTVTYFGQLRQSAGVESEILELAENATYLDLLADRSDQYSESFRKMLLEETGQPRSSIIIVANGSALDKKSLPPLQDGDEITFLTPIAGG